MIEPVGFAVMVLEGGLGWPGRLYGLIGHPVGLFARVITGCERKLNRADWSDMARRIAGLAAMLGLIGMVWAGTAFIVWIVRGMAGDWAWLLLAILAWPALAARSLDDHVRPVLSALEAGDLAEARHAVGMIVGRDTAGLDEAGVVRAAIESLAESFCDGVAAPLFWLLLGGVPGGWAYKAINTADSLIGHPEPPLRAYGWAAARIDDAANLIPARLAGVLICLAGGGGWRVMARDHGRHASPNAGWPEAAMAGVLGVRLAGPIIYDGVLAAKPWIGEEGREAGARDLRRALGIYRRACALLGIIALGVAWLA
ncbi:adenosylcobinamide-phosphate synthase CbiB [Novosphingobium sp. ST904]|uniref:adenosylcobinamide-phosphate synthase CbiB n=1 Tax=Novosphingobium sp. ST904 TaxID=1684385 RepID=UPI0006C8356D|nr:adenosylcobinamide-phosphate synthase CbiB [Novosphingobium sp. ST904]KPH62821.1 adenosylcobinamide-phosphate synthase [Novosphingobium sp. ST904]TCM39234.1 adenosylcobinamide-phosphate synthase [Novosphingobium sp. ST904]